MGVILDVVYNHIGPEGNVLPQFSPEYFTDRYSTDWGVAINYEDAQAGPVREYFLANTGYWIEEFHFDGLRIDATQNIYDTSADHILAALARRVRRAAAGRATLLAYTAGALILQYFDHDFPVAPQSGCVWVKTRQGCIMRHTIPHEPSAT
jgi:1,4-alpha-glucan branching enzyme